ncbi:hypothetical protein GCM10020229_23400 [Kitasatospora albolonga]
MLATGYAHVDPRELLGELAADCLVDGGGRLRVDRDHRVLTAEHVEVGIYLQRRHRSTPRDHVLAAVDAGGPLR